MSAHEALLAATAVHLGFQLVVTVLVYPVLAATSPAGWAAAHATHSRRIAPIVALVYGALVVACGWVLISGPRTPGDLVAIAATVAAAGTTALVAAPTHGRLGSVGPDPVLLRRLLHADRLRLGAASVALVAALLG